MWRLGLGVGGLAASYVLFAGQVSVDELAFGAVCTGLALAWGALVLRVAPKRQSFTPKALLAAVRAGGALPVRTFSVGLALARVALDGRLAGSVGSRRFQPGPKDDSADAGRRAAVVLALSLTPDSFVVDLPHHGQGIALHRLIPSRERGDERWPS